MLTLELSDQGKHFRLSQAQTFILNLAETPTTGFRWAIAKMPSSIRLVSEKFEPPSTRDPGAPGWHNWVFEAHSPGVGELRLELAARTPRTAEPISFTAFLEVTDP
jgi:predicted secreted protein